MRDKNVTDLTYLEKFIAVQSRLLSESYERLSDNQIPLDNISQAHHMLFKKKLEIFIASFGNGESITILKEKFEKLFDNIIEEWRDEACKLRVKGELINQYNLNSYCYMVWLLSISILLGAKKKEIKLLTQIIESSKIKDEIILFLLSNLNGKIYTNKKVTTYNPYKNLVKNNISSLDESRLEQYLKSWYKGTKLMTWHYYNPANDKYFYFGNWSFESSAIVAILNIDDSKFKEHKNYPSDLVIEYHKKTVGNNV